MSPQAETKIGNLLAVLGGAVFAGMVFYLLTPVLNFPLVLGVSLGCLVGVMQFFILRYIFLNIGGRKENSDEP